MVVREMDVHVTEHVHRGRHAAAPRQLSFDVGAVLVGLAREALGGRTLVRSDLQLGVPDEAEKSDERITKEQVWWARRCGVAAGRGRQHGGAVGAAAAAAAAAAAEARVLRRACVLGGPTGGWVLASRCAPGVPLLAPRVTLVSVVPVLAALARCRRLPSPAAVSAAAWRLPPPTTVVPFTRAALIAQ